MDIITFLIKNSYIIYIIIIILIVRCIKIPVSSFKILCTKKTFEIDEKHRMRDSAEILIIFALIFFSVILIPFEFSLIDLINKECGIKSNYETSYQIRFALNRLNDKYNMNSNIGQEAPTTKLEIIEMFQRTNDLVEIYNVPDEKTNEVIEIPKKYIKSNNNPDGIDEKLAETPCLGTNSLYFLNSYKNGCQYYNLKNPQKSDCWLTVDINKFSPPNKLIEYTNDKNASEDFSDSPANGDQFIIVIKPSMSKTENHQSELIAVLPIKTHKYVLKAQNKTK